MSQYQQPPEYDSRPESPVPPVIPGLSGTSRVIRPITPTVTYSLLGLTVFVFLLQMIGQWTYGGLDVAALYGMKVNRLIEAGQFWRLITPMFLHGGLLHLGFNMYALFILGPNLERMYGHARFLALYLLSGFAGIVLSFLLSPGNSLGASTAIFGLLAAQGVFLYQNRSMLQSAQRMLTNLITIAVINLVIGFAPGMNIDNLGHLGGLLGGFMFAWFGGPLLAVEGYSQRVLVDQRTWRQTLLAGVGVLIVFGSLALMEILFI